MRTMPPRAGYLPDVYERNALQKLLTYEQPAVRVGTPSLVAKLLTKGWIERRNSGLRITELGMAALKVKLPE